jgi:hypothetical protein
MRQTRFVAALIALFLAAALPLVSSTGAQASSGHSALVAKAKVKKVTIKFVAHGSKSFTLKGKVKPKVKHKTAKLLRSTKLNGHYAKQRTTKTDKKGRYAFDGLKKEGFYVVKVGNKVSKAIHVCKGACG